MANQQHLEILKQGVDVWNKWRHEHPDIQPDLSGANFSNADLTWADFRGANLREITLTDANLSYANFSHADLTWAYFPGADLKGANLSDATLSNSGLSKADLINANLSRADLSRTGLRGVNFFRADLSETNFSEADLKDANLIAANLSNANLSKAQLRGADFTGANLSGATLRNTSLTQTILVGITLTDADLSGANLSYSNLSEADLSRTNLNGAHLIRAILVKTNLTEVILTNCLIYGISAWDVQLEGAIQFSLIITPPKQPTISVDNLEVAQFIYLLLNNKKIRDVIDTITSKVVLILGRFTPERKVILDALRDELRNRNYLPVLFDFEKPASRDLTETISTLAHIARFVIADITDAKSIPQELGRIVPNLPSVPVQPLILKSQHQYGMFEHFTRYPWVLPVYRYTDEETLLLSVKECILDPAEQKAKELSQP